MEHSQVVKAMEKVLQKPATCLVLDRAQVIEVKAGDTFLPALEPGQYGIVEVRIAIPAQFINAVA